MGFKTYYDSATDTIYGCKKYSLSWWHEMGHRDWCKKGIEQAIQMWQFLLTIGAVFMLTQNVYKIAELIMYIVVILVFISEFHAWKYAFKYRRKYKKMLRDKK